MEKACASTIIACLEHSQNEKACTLHCKHVLENSRDENVCVLTTSACLKHSRGEKLVCSPQAPAWSTLLRGEAAHPSNTSGKHARLGEATLCSFANWSVHWWRHTSSDSPGCPRPPPFQTRTEPSLVKYDRVTALRLDRGQRHPVASIARPKQLNSDGTPSQLARLARASNGLAEACPKLFSVLSSAARPTPFQPMNKTYEGTWDKWSSGRCLLRPFRGSAPN